MALEFDTQAFLQSQNLTPTGRVGPSGLPLVTNEKGEDGEFDLNAAMSHVAATENVDLKEAKPAPLNTPDDARPISPLVMKDRIAIHAGTPTGNLSYLKTKYEDAMLHPEKGLIVQDGGVWKQADPSLLDVDDSWEFTKELLKDAGTKGVDAMAGTAAFIGGGLGAGLAGVFGAGMAISAMRSSLGRALGTYDASDAEQLADASIEGGLNLMFAAAGPAVKAAAGKAFQAGVKPTADKLISVFSNAGKSLGDKVSEPLRQLYGKMLHTTPEATKLLLSEAPSLRPLAKESIAKGTEKVVNLSARSLNDVVNTAIPKQVNLASAELIGKSSKLGPIDPSEIVKDLGSGLAESGLVVMNRLGKNIERYAIPSTAQRQALDAAGRAVAPISEAEHKALQPLINYFNDNLMKPVKGSGINGARVALGMKRDLTTIVNALPETLRERVGQPILSQFNGKLGASYSKAGLANEYATTAQKFNMLDAQTREAKTFLGQGAEGAARFARSVMEREPSATSIAGLMPTEALGALKRQHAAVELSSMLPNKVKEWFPTTTAKAVGGALVGAAAHSLPGVGPLAKVATGAVAGGVAAITSPKLNLIVNSGLQKAGPAARVGIQAMQRGSEWIASHSPETMKKLASDPAALEAFLAATSSSVGAYDQTSQEASAAIQQVTNR